MITVLKRHYTNFNILLNALPEHRQRHTYKIVEIIKTGLMIFIFKRGSKNNTDKMFTIGFESNYLRLFGLLLPVTETVNQFLKKLPPGEPKNLKRTLIKELVKKKVFDKFSFNNKLV